MKQLKFLIIALGMAFTIACDDNESPQPTVSENGFLILNEGAFQGSNASLSYFSMSDSTVTNDVFFAANNRSLGDQAQGITGYDGNIFLTIQNSGKIEIINSTDFSEISTVDSRLTSPRYTYAGSEGIYVSDWNDGYNGWLKKVDPSNFQVIDSVETGSGPSLPNAINGKIWVPNAGGYSTDSTVSIFNTDLSFDKEIYTGINPAFIIEDAAGKVWVICKGKSWPAEGVRPSSIMKYDRNGNFEQEIAGPDGGYFNSASYNSTSGLIYLGTSDGIHVLDVQTGQLTESLIDISGVYGMEYIEANDWIAVAVPVGFTTAGEIHIFNTDGSFVKKETVGIAPNGFTYVQK
ncbi:hypothetical protein OO013_14600 [Mangrovivirga sp. M17]|uniref:Cell surface protein n=1 Tax=Mangrovivirga halotolerans TaxID=2993936 RepID=A0ABT3RU60_9BACT|nr:DUF5074 domain-containing protein [Mangrovivirga halotolerans]MCX2745107.1 hypothetical protein [Mangrovivirga halotolerans]